MSVFVKRKKCSTPQLVYNIKYLFTLLFSLFVLSGCGLTDNKQLVSYAPIYERMDGQCIEQVQDLQKALSTANQSQYLTLANSASHCVGDISFSPKHPDTQLAMQFSALALVNYVKAGDIKAAENTLTAFRARFPQQDLLFSDYSSFVDTALVLLKQNELSDQQIAMLNINPSLRDEIKRQRKWSLN